MKSKLCFLFATCLIIPLMTSCSLDKEIKKIEHKAALINNYESVALKLARENRELKTTVKRLEFEVQKLKQENAFNHLKMVGHSKETLETPSRGIASIAHTAETPAEKSKKDYVEFKTYKWTADDMLKIADKEFKQKNFEKAAQYYTSLIQYYPRYAHSNDEFFFKAGISAYESGNHHDWTLKHFGVLMSKYPTSQYFRGAKLWIGLTYMKLGEKQKFFETVEEFRKKYRNTNEWKILSSYYENIEEKTHE